ncbi:hypothetical protein PHLGIDRAFT_120091 [Phlebiopsis gigantea 11061_1 CR5-6]|uniref:Uncharacterized protein n=1 Tax=Phlebiopsis gigantea (strain 11061_1 CR5-6) TaxID=745531 RepID=A0A0C3S4N3_PHLG1|nr:hypothetical protein PHLGIDRAFT_120091 [Phlebiopsis gigantea 11061_1 CR5-6]
MLALDGQTSGLRHVGADKRLFEYVRRHHDARYRCASDTLGLAVRQGEIDRSSPDVVGLGRGGVLRLVPRRPRPPEPLRCARTRPGGDDKCEEDGRRHHKDQCTFVSRYWCKRKGWLRQVKGWLRQVKGWLRQVKAAAGPPELPRSDGDGHDEINGISEPRGAADTDDESSDADTAIACDDDLILLLSGKEWPVNMKAYLGRTGPPFSVDGDKRWILGKIGQIYFQCESHSGS